MPPCRTAERPDREKCLRREWLVPNSTRSQEDQHLRGAATHNQGIVIVLQKGVKVSCYAQEKIRSPDKLHYARIRLAVWSGNTAPGADRLRLRRAINAGTAIFRRNNFAPSLALIARSLSQSSQHREAQGPPPSKAFLLFQKLLHVNGNRSGRNTIGYDNELTRAQFLGSRHIEMC